MNDHEFMKIAFDEAFKGMRTNDGGPFGCVIVKDGNIIGRGHNCVTINNDPTAHAEVTAIRDACKRLGGFDLSGAMLYATCEPCPMCLSAIYWARISTVYYAGTRYDAASAGFSDEFIYNEFSKPHSEKAIGLLKVENDIEAISVQALVEKLFSEWKLKPDKQVY